MWPFKKSQPLNARQVLTEIGTQLMEEARRVQTVVRGNDIGQKKPIHGLKVKVMTLGAEQRIIRQQEQKALKAARINEIRSRLTDAGFTQEKIDRIIKKASSFRARFNDLREHRINHVRPEARAAGLAYGFLRGVPLKAMEQKSYTAPPVERVRYHVLKFSPDIQEQVILQRFAEWLDTAGEWAAPVKNDSAAA